MNKNILVTGGAGFIGTHLCSTLVELGYNVTSIDLKEPVSRVSGVNYVTGDARNTELLRQWLLECNTVYHLAATVSVPSCQQNPVESYSNNFESTLILLEMLRAENEKRRAERVPPLGMVFSSTAAIYGTMGNDGRSLEETMIPEKFLSFYAAQKHASEQAIQLYCEYFRIPAIIFRFFNVYGSGQDPHSPYSGVITLFIDRARRGQPLLLNDGGYQTRDFVSVTDLVRACTEVLNHPKEKWVAQVMNLGVGECYSVRQLAEMINAQFGNKSELVAAPAREGDVLHSKASIARAISFLSYKPSISLLSGLGELCRKTKD